MVTRHQRFEWIRPGPTGRLAEFSIDALKGLSPTRSFRADLRRVGVPRTMDAATPLEDLLGLLRAAAEIEHGLMIQYLFAGYSIVPTTTAYARVLNVAVEEMGHWLTVQNLLLAAGGSPWLGRYDDGATEFAPFPWRLEAATRDVIAKFAVSERPDGETLSAEELAILPELLEAATRSATVEPLRVGLLYAQIYWLLRPDDDEMTDEQWPDFPVDEMRAVAPGWHVADFPTQDTVSRQGANPPWRGPVPSLIIETIGSRGDALAAVASISGQGEGFAHAEDAHFDRFRTIFAGGPVAVRPAVTDPWYAGAPGGPGPAGSELDDPVTVELARLTDKAYDVVLSMSAAALELPGTADIAQRQLVGKRAISLMREVVKPAAEELLNRPARSGGDPTVAVAAAPFRLPAPIGPGGRAALEGSNRALDEAEAIAVSLAASADPSASLIGEDAVFAITRARAALSPFQE
jgi:hypothetical protein